MFLYASIEIGPGFPCVTSYLIADRLEHRDALRKKVEIEFDTGTLAIAYDKSVFVKSVRVGRLEDDDRTA
jgi:hypothetical protein